MNLEASDDGSPPRVLIVCDSASAVFGGEASIPLHYFRVLRKFGIPVWLVTHARTRDELSKRFPGDSHIRYVEDTALDRWMWRLGHFLPARVAVMTVGFVSRLRTQLAQRRLARKLVEIEGIDVVHQPVPVSPKEPSAFLQMGAPMVIGPMNGGMTFPPAFRSHAGPIERVLVRAGRASATWLNRLIAGKREAELLLVANDRTRAALPPGLTNKVELLVENGVDLAVWSDKGNRPLPGSEAPAVFVFFGRLVDWKGVDILLRAFCAASASSPMRLLVIGDGVERRRLEALTLELGMDADRVEFAGWLPQPASVERMRDGDCLVLPSLYECGGAVVLEAMALGKPVIATAWGGPADYIDQDCGILVSPAGREEFVHGLGDAMVKLARDPAERRRLGGNGLAKVKTLYDWDVKVRTMLRYYRALQSLKGAEPTARQ